MNLIIDATVCAVKEDDRVNFNFTNKDYSESWCIGPKVNLANRNPLIGQNVKIHGDWVIDASGTKVFFHATHIEDCI